jgi:hypothetical protein
MNAQWLRVFISPTEMQAGDVGVMITVTCVEGPGYADFSGDGTTVQLLALNPLPNAVPAVFDMEIGETPNVATYVTGATDFPAIIPGLWQFQVQVTYETDDEVTSFLQSQQIPMNLAQSLIVPS